MSTVTLVPCFFRETTKNPRQSPGIFEREQSMLDVDRVPEQIVRCFADHL